MTTRQTARLALILVLAACGGGGSTGPTTGSLSIAVSGLPAGAAADVTVSGPNGYNQRLDGSETLSGIPEGAYTVTAAGVAVEVAQYSPSPGSQQVTVNGGDLAVAGVAYSAAGGTLAVTVSGLPAGTDAAVTVSGPGGYTRQVTASETIHGLATGQYTVTALAVSDGSEQYSPAPSSQTTTIGASGSASATVNYSTGGTAGFNLRIDGLYLVQSVQTLARNVPLVRDRDALLRVFVTANQVNTANPPVRVSLYGNGTLSSTMTIPAGGLTTPLGADDSNLNNSWNIVLDQAVIQPNLSIKVEVDPDNAFGEADESDNVFPSSGTPLALDVRTADPFSVRFVPVITKADNRQGNVTTASRDDFLQATMQMHPLSSYDAVVHAPYTTTSMQALQSNNQGSWNAVLSELNALRNTEGSSRYYYGVVNPAYSSGIAGIGYIGGPVAVGWDKLPSGSSVAAHEWGHNWGREHAPCGEPANPDVNYPYSGGEIGVIGYDLENEDLKPANSHDLMGYCGNEWISDYTYLGVMNFRAAESFVGGGLGGAIQPGLLVWGRIENGQAILEPSFRVTARPSLPTRPGPYRLEGRADDGSRIFGFDFAPLRVADDPDGAQQFAYVIPLQPDRASRLASLHLAGPAAQASMAQVSTEPAAVQVTRGGAGRLAVRWDASKAPMVLVRDPVSGEVLSFARGGSVEVPTNRDELSLIVSDRVRSRELRVRAQAR